MVKVLYDRRARKRLSGLRPVVMCFAISGEGEILLVRPGRDPNIWIPPQEGLKLGESIEIAATRCLSEELGINAKKMQYRKNQWIADRKIIDRKGERDIEGSPIKMRGKSYYAAHLIVDKQSEMEVNSVEIAEYEWTPVAEMEERLRSNQNDKFQIVFEAAKQLGILN